MPTDHPHHPPPRPAPARRAFAVIVALAGAAALGTAMLALLRAGASPRLAAPPVDPRRWADWTADRDPLDVIAAVARVVTIAALGWVALATTAHLVACLIGGERWGRRTARLTPAPLAALVAALVMGGSPLAGATSHQGPPAASDPAVPGAGAQMVLVTDTTTTTTTPTTTTTTTTPAATAPAATPITAPPPTATPPTVGVPTASPTVLVRSGDHLWGIAERRVALALGTTPTEDQVRPYWQALIEANRDRLVEAGNPDLVEPGQELVLPG